MVRKVVRGLVEYSGVEWSGVEWMGKGVKDDQAS